MPSLEERVDELAGSLKAAAGFIDQMESEISKRTKALEEARSEVERAQREVVEDRALAKVEAEARVAVSSVPRGELQMSDRRSWKRDSLMMVLGRPARRGVQGGERSDLVAAQMGAARLVGRVGSAHRLGSRLSDDEPLSGSGRIAAASRRRSWAERVGADARTLERMQDVKTLVGGDDDDEGDGRDAFDLELTEVQRQFIAGVIEPLRSALAAQNEQVAATFAAAFKPIQEQLERQTRVVLDAITQGLLAESFRSTAEALRPQLQQAVAAFAGGITVTAATATLQASAQGASVSAGSARAEVLRDVVGLTDSLVVELTKGGRWALGLQVPDPTWFLVALAILTGIASAEAFLRNDPVRASVLGVFSGMYWGLASVQPKER